MSKRGLMEERMYQEGWQDGVRMLKAELSTIVDDNCANSTSVDDVINAFNEIMEVLFRLDYKQQPDEDQITIFELL